MRRWQLLQIGCKFSRRWSGPNLATDRTWCASSGFSALVQQPHIEQIAPRGKRRTTVAVAVARELACFVWEIARQPDG